MLEILVKYLVIPSCPFIIKNEALKYLIGFLCFWPEWSNVTRFILLLETKLSKKNRKIYKTMFLGFFYIQY